MQKKHCLNFEAKSWTREERIELVKGVEQQVQESRIRSVMDLYSASNNDPTFLDDQVRTIAENPPTPEDIRKALPMINWNEVARLYVIGRSPTECWIQWSNHEDSLINHGAWTKAEDKKLWSIVKQHKLCNWDLIAQELGSRRSISQCLVRYQRSLNAGIVRGAWTHEEDEQLRAAVQKYGDQDWLSVASELEGRTGPQCWNRWHKILNPIRQKSGRWSINEDKRLRLAVSVYGPRMWKLIAVHVPGRTEVQCRERWCNVLDPSLTWAEWNPEEDRRLEEAVTRHGSHRWSTVASELIPRTDSQCWRRWKHLHPELLSVFQKDNKIQKAALISNFVGRKRERSKLRPSDFVPEAGAGAFKTVEKDCEQDDSIVMEPVGFCEEGMSATPRVEVGVPAVTPELSKKRRLERLQKLREARATGKMVAWKRSGMSTNYPGDKHRKPPERRRERREGKGKRLTAKGRCNPSKNGVTAFVKAMQELANICEKTQNPSVAVLLPLSTSKKIGDKGQAKAGDSSSNLDIDETGKEAPESVGEDEDVETAVKAVLSWPFSWGLHEFLEKAP
ncbi:hypothetical protein GOP47_0023044 [Adiantum capillus-veneris]|uniref:Uncharacterized protein n=1 Tax=Adiantum capillus-veneris TaxID=13818 RepID=A0A9D4U7E8_ADICA|nr:hypothetical protein GOP47_0023044 [Adiantum capillus-veneris]